MSDAGERHRFFFLHLMKTAGSSLRRRLDHHFGERAVYPTRDVDGSDPVKLMLSIDFLRERLAVRGDEIRVVAGHFPLCAVEMIEGRYTTLTLLRDPVERVLSQLRQARRDNERGSRDRPLEDIYEDGFLNNQMAVALTRTPDEVEGMRSLSREEALAALLTQVEFTPERVQRARRTLAGIDVVGLQEDLDGFCDRLEARFGWDLGEPVRVNTTEPVAVPDTLRARIAADNAVDAELYALARDLAARS